MLIIILSVAIISSVLLLTKLSTSIFTCNAEVDFVEISFDCSGDKIKCPHNPIIPAMEPISIDFNIFLF